MKRVKSAASGIGGKGGAPEALSNRLKVRLAFGVISEQSLSNALLQFVRAFNPETGELNVKKIFSIGVFIIKIQKAFIVNTVLNSSF